VSGRRWKNPFACGIFPVRQDRPLTSLAEEEGAIAFDPDKSDLATPSSSSGPASSSSSLSRYLHYGALALVLIGGAAYWALKPATLNPMADPRAADAMALVQTHRALGATTLLQAVNERVRARSERGEGVRAGEWSVKPLGKDRYMVEISIREQSANKTQWFEREFQWEANLAARMVIAVSVPAQGLMPVDDNQRMPLYPPR
jgi:hypothetical protein